MTDPGDQEREVREKARSHDRAQREIEAIERTLSSEYARGQLAIAKALIYVGDGIREVVEVLRDGFGQR